MIWNSLNRSHDNIPTHQNQLSFISQNFENRIIRSISKCRITQKKKKYTYTADKIRVNLHKKNIRIRKNSNSRRKTRPNYATTKKTTPPKHQIIYIKKATTFDSRPRSPTRSRKFGKAADFPKSRGWQASAGRGWTEAEGCNPCVYIECTLGSDWLILNPSRRLLWDQYNGVVITPVTRPPYIEGLIQKRGDMDRR